MNQIMMFIEANILFVILGAGVSVFLVWLISMHHDKRNRIDLTDLIVENNILSERKVARFGAFLISSWGFIWLVATNQLSDSYYLTYMGIWCANSLLGKKLENDAIKLNKSDTKVKEEAS